MHRFFIPNADLNQKNIILNDLKEIHHLTHVLRLKKGSKISIFNEHNVEGEGTIVNFNIREVQIQINSSKKVNFQFPLITLACAMPKKSKFETIIEKATELGVHKIIPLQTKRTEIHLKGEREEKKLLRFQSVAINAAKQSKRANVPQIQPVTDFSKALDYLSQHTKIIIPSLIGNRIPLKEALNQTQHEKHISFLIGPEGDFTEEEYKTAHSRACIPVSLGKTILKVETAALCVVACARQFNPCD